MLACTCIGSVDYSQWANRKALDVTHQIEVIQLSYPNASTKSFLFVSILDAVFMYNNYHTRHYHACHSVAHARAAHNIPFMKWFHFKVVSQNLHAREGFTFRWWFHFFGMDPNSRERAKWTHPGGFEIDSGFGHSIVYTVFQMLVPIRWHPVGPAIKDNYLIGYFQCK